MNRARRSRRSAHAAAVGTIAACVAVAASAAATAEAPVVHDRIDYREINGASEAALVSDLNRSAITDADGHRFYAHTHWSLRWDIRVESADDLCRIAKFSSTLDIDMSLPRWRPPASAPSDLVARWNAFAAALRAHEDGHRDRSLQAAREVERRVGTIAPLADCETLKRRANDVANAVLDEYRAKERRYDDDTEHGRKQGAHFP